MVILPLLDINTAKFTTLLSRLPILLQQDEDQLLNGIWIGLLSVEALMVLGVMVRGLFRGLASSKWFRSGLGQRTRHSMTHSVDMGVTRRMNEERHQWAWVS
ncbi:hypothetical protein N657DRAFT_630777 [Parathielavia appendiculata]|uniref:Uncharacterized protein n=1 Tax=Parathielavia appendiculata TaxID=2587402 RepID=A0AAN6U5I9_9PEZI|nr:hypothetical protein N657DRAFT_630777 [Parathielavia appendiculata]